MTAVSNSVTSTNSFSCSYRFRFFESSRKCSNADFAILIRSSLSALFRFIALAAFFGRFYIAPCAPEFLRIHRVRFLRESMRNHHNSPAVRAKVARHSNLEILELPELFVQLLKMFSVLNSPCVTQQLEKHKQPRLVLLLL